MDSRQKRATAADRVYDDFEPSMEWLREPEADTLRVYLPGFKKEQMKVQITSSRKLRISGERPLNEGNRWSRFHEEILIGSNYDSNGIGAKFDKGMLLIGHPKIIVSDNEPQEMIILSTEAPKPPPQQTPKPLKPQPPADAPKLKQQLSDVLKPRKPPATGETSKLATKTDPQVADTSKMGMDRQSGKAHRVGNGKTVSQQITEKEKETGKEKQKRNGMADAAGKGIMTPSVTFPKQEKGADFVQDKTGKNGVGTGIIRGSYYKFATENFKKVCGDMVMEMKKPRNLKWVLVLLIAFLGMHAFSYIRISNI